jgi:hypothetical protein
VLSASSIGTSGVSPQAVGFLDQLIAQLTTSVANIGTRVSFAPPSQDQWNTASLPDFSAIQKLTDNLGKAVDGLNQIVTLLQKVLQIIELFVSGFSSFSKIIESIIGFGETTVNNFVQDLKGGVYLNIVAPPAFLAKYNGNPYYIEQSRGGFEGFLTRLQASIDNPNDINRPNFSPDAVVGGMVVLLDSQSLDKIWVGLKQLAALFDFVKLFGLNLTPPPPTGLHGRCGFFNASTGFTTPTQQLGIKLEWQSSSIASNYLVYRSTVPGGVTQEVEYIPSTLMNDPDTNEPGLFSIAKDMLFSLFTSNPVTKPTRFVQVYNDPTFNAGKPVQVKSNVSGVTISFIDTFVDENVPQYFYVVKSGETGQNSIELSVLVRKCNDLPNKANVIQQPEGHFEFLSMGFGNLNSWSSIQLSAAVPWVGELADMLIKFLDSMKGMVNDATDSFTGFITQIGAKLKLYVGILQTVSYVINMFKSFVIGESISFLELPPAQGGTSYFVDRIRQAKLPSDITSFSDENGISIGIVLMYAGDEIIANAIGFIMSLFVKK